jgi:hypothetical protein
VVEGGEVAVDRATLPARNQLVGVDAAEPVPAAVPVADELPWLATGALSVCAVDSGVAADETPPLDGAEVLDCGVADGRSAAPELAGADDDGPEPELDDDDVEDPGPPALCWVAPLAVVWSGAALPAVAGAGAEAAVGAAVADASVVAAAGLGVAAGAGAAEIALGGGGSGLTGIGATVAGVPVTA